MASYTIEDIELLRRKSGISYQEAVALLDYHDGNLARALIDLEKNGRLKEENGMENGSRANSGSSNGSKNGETKQKALNILQKLYRSRVKVQKGKTPIVNFSVMFAALCLIFAPHMTIFGFILSLILGYQFSFTKLDEDFASDSIEKMVRNAAQNAKNSVSSAVQSFTDDKKAAGATETVRKTGEETKSPAKAAVQTTDDDPAETLRKQTKEIEETMDSFFESSPGAADRQSAYSAAASKVPTIQIPVQAETKDGKVEIHDDQDGFSSVTVG